MALHNVHNTPMRHKRQAAGWA